MRLRTLTKITLIGALALINGCEFSGDSGVHEEYLFPKDTLEGDSLFFEIEGALGSKYLSNTLYVIKSDGREVDYYDHTGNDLILDLIIANGVSYSPIDNTEVSDSVMKIGQQQFDEYLEKIKQRKLEQALNSIR
jgi:hypothetical protein